MLAQSEVQAHLALALRTNNVGVFLGAGASVEIGCPTMASLWEAMSTDLPDQTQWLLEHGFVDEIARPDLERAIDRLGIAEQDLVRRGSSPEELETVRGCRASIYRSLLKSCLVDEGYWSSDESPATDPRFEGHTRLLARLLSSRVPGQDAPWVFTTNYDLAVEWAAERIGVESINGFGGLHSRRFASSRFELGLRNVQASGLARIGSLYFYLAKIHGSLTWLASGEENHIQELAAEHMWTHLAPVLYPSATSRDPSELVLILPNTQKFVSTASHIYGELIRRFTEFLARDQTTLIFIGYSFNDEHVNRLVASALRNSTLHLIICLPELSIDVATRFDRLSPTATQMLRPLVEMASPRITFVAGPDAYFDNITGLLPEPALFDSLASDGSKMERTLDVASE